MGKIILKYLPYAEGPFYAFYRRKTSEKSSIDIQPLP